MNLLDSYSKLNRYKVRNGVKVSSNNDSTCVYLIYKTIEKYLTQHATKASRMQGFEISDDPRLSNCLDKLNKMNREDLTGVLFRMNNGFNFTEVVDYICKKRIK